MNKTVNTITNLIYIGGFVGLMTFTINTIINNL